MAKSFTAAEPVNWHLFCAGCSVSIAIFLLGVLIVFLPWFTEEPARPGTYKATEPAAIEELRAGYTP